MPVKNYVPCKIAQNTKRNLVPWKAEAASSRSLPRATPAIIAKGSRLIPWQPSTLPRTNIEASSEIMLRLRMEGLEGELPLRYRPGVGNSHKQWVNSSDLEILETTNIKDVRTDFFWDSTPWPVFDNIVIQAQKRKIELLIILHDMYRKPGYKYSSDDLDEIKNHFIGIVARYKPGGELAQEQGWGNSYGVRYWQIGNEANLFADLRRRYKEFFRACVEGVLAGDPVSAKIIMCGMWGRFCGGQEHPESPREFLRAMFSDRFFKDHVDAIAIHPYRRPDSPERKKEDFWDDRYFCTMEEELIALKAFTDSHSNRNLPIWLTEIGWYTDIDHVTKFNASKYMTRVFHFMSDLPFVERVYWYHLIDGKDHGEEFHLFRKNGSPTLAGRTISPPPIFNNCPNNSRETGYTGLQRQNMTQRAYFTVQVNRGQRVSIHGHTLAKRPPGASQRGHNYETRISICGPLEEEEPVFHWDEFGSLNRDEGSVSITCPESGTYSIALRPIPDWEPRYFNVYFTVR